MKKTMILSAVCTMAMLLSTGCSANEPDSGSQENNSATSGETAEDQVNENTAETAAVDPAETQTDEASSTVYFTSDISASGLVKIYDALAWTPQGNVAVKISTGEPPASNYLRPELIGDLFRKWMARLWNAIPHTAGPVQALPCINRSRKIMALRRLPTLI